MAKSRGDLIIFSLTPMQVAIISVGAILVLTFTFLLGVTVGKQRAPTAVSSTTAPKVLEEKPPAEEKEEPPHDASAVMAAPDEAPQIIEETTVESTPPEVLEVAGESKKETEKYEKYTLQVASLKKREAAEKFSEQLSNKGYFTYVEEANLGERGLWYRVKLGGFPTMAEANSMKETLEAEHGIKSLVVLK